MRPAGTTETLPQTQNKKKNPTPHNSSHSAITTNPVSITPAVQNDQII